MSDEPAKVCIANIGAAGRRQRLTLGVVLLAAGVAAAVLLIAFGVPRPLRLALFALFWIGALGVFQARAHT
jgi:hypothetical protein